MRVRQGWKLTYPNDDFTVERIVIADNEEEAKAILRIGLGRPNLGIHCVGPVEILEES